MLTKQGLDSMVHVITMPATGREISPTLTVMSEYLSSTTFTGDAILKYVRQPYHKVHPAQAGKHPGSSKRTICHCLPKAAGYV